MLNKALFKPFVENFAFQRNEKSISYIQLTPDISSNTLTIEIKSMQKMSVSYQYTNLEDGDMEVRDCYSNGLINYNDFCKEISAMKARNRLQIKFTKAGVMIEEIDVNDVVIVHMLKVIDDTLVNDLTAVTSCSKDACIKSDEIMSLAYMNDLRLDLEAVPQLNGVSLKYADGYLYFCSSIGSSLHCCKVEMEENILDGKEYMIPSVYMKDMLMLDSECLYLNIVEIGNSKGIQFSTSEVSIILPVTEIKKEDSIFSNFIKVETIKNAKWMMKFTSEVFEDKNWKYFVKKEVSLRKTHNDDKFASFMVFNADFSDYYDGQNLMYRLKIENIGEKVERTAPELIHANFIEKPDESVNLNAHPMNEFKINSFDFIKFVGGMKNKEVTCTVGTDEKGNRFIVLNNENKYLYTPCV